MYWVMQQKSRCVIYEMGSHHQGEKSLAWQDWDNGIRKDVSRTLNGHSLFPGLLLSQPLPWLLLQLKQSSELQTQIWSCLHEIKWWNLNVNKFKVGLLVPIPPKNSYSWSPSVIPYCRKHISFHSFAHPNPSITLLLCTTCMLTLSVQHLDLWFLL